MTEKTEQTNPEEAETMEIQPATAGDDLASLQAEVAELRQQVAAHDEEKQARRHPWRRFVVGLLIVLGCIVFAFANYAFWLRDTALNTEGWLAAVGPLTKNPVVADAVSGYVVQELYTALDVEQLLSELLPPRLEGLSGPAGIALQGLVQDTVSTAIQSDQFQEIWRLLNRTIHGALVTALRGDLGLLQLERGQLILPLDALLGPVGEGLGLGSLEQLLGEDAFKIVLFSSSTLAVLQQVVYFLDVIGVLLPLVAFVLFFLAWLVSLWRRQTVFWIGMGIAITMALSLLVSAIVWPLALGSVPTYQIRIVAEEILNTVTRYLTIQTVLLLIVGLLIALAAWLAGPHPSAVAFVNGVGQWWDGLRGEPKPAPEENVE
jgi:hypothetical protein